MPRRFRNDEPEEGQPSGPFQPIQLPTTLNLIVYPRQSTQAQLLHHATSTEMQTADLIEIGVRYGWLPEKCVIIDDDLGVSGTLSIDERIGLTKVMEQIDQLQSRAVLVVNEDRLFRDETMIQVNVFIKFMRDHNAYVLTPYMVYNFQERFHVKMFREKAEYAASYITDYVRERLNGARRKKALKGLYDGRPLTPGYRVDYDKKRPDGSENPTYRKYVIYEPHAAVVRQLAQVMYDQDLSVTELYRYAQDNGLIFPPWEVWVDSRTRERTNLTEVAGGLFYASLYGLYSMLTNPVYIGYWLLLGRTVQRHNHEPILSESVFKAIFERISYYDLNGGYNTQRQRRRPYPTTRVVRSSEEAGVLLGLLVDVSDETPAPVTYHHQVVNHRDPDAEPIMYYVCPEPGQVPPGLRWTLQATVLDKPVSEAFLNRLRCSQVAYDPVLYEQQAAARLAELKHREKVLETQLHEIQEQMEGNLRAMTLRGLTDDEMAFFLNRKRSLEGELHATENKLETIRSQQQDAQEMGKVFKTLDELLTNWPKLNVRQQRRYLTRFVQMVGIKFSTTGICDLWIYWKNTFDETLDAAEIDTLRVRLKRARPTEWTEERNAILRDVYLLSQVEIMKRLPECTWGAICRQINRLGLDRRAALTALGRWPEYRAIRDHYSYNDWQLEHPDDPDPTPPPMRKLPKQRWTAEEDALLRENLHLPRLELMKLFPDRSWASINNRWTGLKLPRSETLAAHGISTNAGFGKACPIPMWMSYNMWIAQQAQPPQPLEADAPPFGLNALVDNLSD
jgi:DNA invertase Pin-like site-specific DNA recombinase